jgi:hypothetical protein
MNISSDTSSYTPTSTINDMLVFHAHPSIKDKELYKILNQNQELKEISLARCQHISAKGFIKAKFPSTIKSINLSYTQITGKGLHNLFSRCQQLEILQIIACYNITPIGFLNPLLPPNLKHVIFDHTALYHCELEIIFTAIKSNRLQKTLPPALSEQAFVNYFFSRRQL